MLTLDSAEGQWQKLVLFLLSVPFCLQARGKKVIRIAYKRDTTFSLEEDRIQESSFPPPVFFFLRELHHCSSIQLKEHLCTCNFHIIRE